MDATRRDAPDPAAGPDGRHDALEPEDPVVQFHRLGAVLEEIKAALGPDALAPEPAARHPGPAPLRAAAPAVPFTARLVPEGPVPPHLPALAPVTEDLVPRRHRSFHLTPGARLAPGSRSRRRSPRRGA